MKQIKTIVLFSILLFCSAFIFNGCKSNKKPGARYCSFVLRSNRCNISKDIQGLCFECNGAQCPDLTNKQVYLKRGEKDSCLVSLGNKNSDCGNCPEGDSIVVLSSIVHE